MADIENIASINTPLAKMEIGQCEKTSKETLSAKQISYVGDKNRKSEKRVSSQI